MSSGTQNKAWYKAVSQTSTIIQVDLALHSSNVHKLKLPPFIKEHSGTRAQSVLLVFTLGPSVLFELLKKL